MEDNTLTELKALDTLTELKILCQKLTEAKAEKSKLEDFVKEVNVEIDDLELKIFETMQANAVDRVAFDGRLYYPVVQSFPSVDKQHENEFYAWCRDHDEDGIFKMTCNVNTLRAWYSRNEQYAEELSDLGFLKVHQRIHIADKSAK